MVSLCASGVAWSADATPRAELGLFQQNYFYHRGIQEGPLSQVIPFGWVRTESKIGSRWRVFTQSHIQVEAVGLKQTAWDSDRFYLEYTRPSPAEGVAGYRVLFGRAHPLEEVGSPDALRPWGLVGQSFPSTQGLAIGVGVGGGRSHDDPMLAGWLGVQGELNWGRTRLLVAASPLFIPGQGPGWIIDPKGELEGGRFAVSPPTQVALGGVELGFRPEIDVSQISRELLQPQVGVWINHEAGLHRWELGAWMAPDPSPSIETESWLQVGADQVWVAARIKPHFPELGHGTLTHRMRLADLGALGEWHTYQTVRLQTAPSSSGSGRLAGELGLRNGVLDLAVTHDFSPTSASPLHERIWVDAHGAIPGTRGWLVGSLRWVTDASLKSSWFWVRAEIKEWIEAGYQVFDGEPSQVFGQWSRNDQFYILTRWRL